jgi:hypothetical protein
VVGFYNTLYLPIPSVSLLSRFYKMIYFPRLNQLYVLIDVRVDLKEIDQMGIDFYEKIY